MKRHLLAAVLAALLVSAAAQAQDVPLAKDTPTATASGNPFIAPMDWTVSRKGDTVVLTPPEAGSRIVLVDVAGKDADAAVAAAWAAIDATGQWPMKIAIDRPARDGWEQVRIYNYETSANDKRGVQAIALRKGAQWTVAIYDMSNATGEKRSGQVSKIFDRLLPKGETRESFAGRKAHSLDAARLKQLDAFVEQMRQEFDVPGVAIGIVQDGNVVMSKGFGVRELGKPAKVDGDTRFMIASNTKALTTLMLA
ncbi:MAG: serine hydrolase domain-containing protein, partial [Thermomonas sp.]